MNTEARATPPTADELDEEQLIGAVMLHGATDQGPPPPEVVMLEPEDFSTMRHSTLWAAIRGVLDRGETPDLVGLHAEMRSWEDGVDMATLMLADDLANECMTAANVAAWARAVRRNARYRETRSRVGEALNKSNHGGSAEALASEVIGAVQDMPAEGITDTEPAGKVLARTIAQIEERWKNRGKPMGLQTGLRDLDAMLCGMHPGDLIILAARPSMGKTAMAMQIAVENTNGEGVTVVISAEMVAEQLGQRMLAITSGVDMQSIRLAQLGETDFAKLSAGAQRVQQAQVDITDKVTDLRQLRAVMRRYAARKVKLVVVDYLQLLGGSGDSREEEVSGISRALKAIAKEHRCPVIALSQLNRSLEARPDKRPILSDLRESGAIEQDADTVIMLYRDDYYARPEDEERIKSAGKKAPRVERGVAEVLIRKQRQGPTGVVKLAWQESRTRFRDLVKQ